MNYECGTMAVPAVPGAGKTFIVTNLVAKLLEENKNEKGKILILTYMNSAANNFKGRIKKILEEHLQMLSKISSDESLMIENPILLQVINDGIKTTALALLFFDKVWH